MAAMNNNAVATPVKSEPVSALDTPQSQTSPDSNPGSSPYGSASANRADQGKYHSYRFSKDLAEIRKFTGSDAHDDDPMFNDTESTLDMDEYAASGDERNDKSASREDLNSAAYSTLSKRADFILANAKKKLNLLEGNLGRARHSLLITPQNMTELRTQSSLSSYAPGSPMDDESGSVRIAPRFNFTPPRQARASPTTSRRTSGGHTRMYSDTSVPLPGSQAIKGARSLEHIGNQDEIQAAHRHNAEEEDEEETETEAEGDSTLESVEEVEEAERRQSMNALRNMYGAGSPTPKSTQELRDQAEELRSRIAYLQKRSGDDSARSNGRSANSAAEQTERAFQVQVNALQKSLEDQERVIEELEAAERTAQEIENDPRGEWHQVLSRNETRGDDEFSEDEYFEYDDEYDDGEVPDALENEEFDESKSMAGAHEDREDAFDYEHFILHSGMVFPHTRQSSSGSSSAASEESVESQSTERGDATNMGDASADDVESDWNQLQQANASSASLATTQSMQSFETAQEANDSSSDVGSDASDVPENMMQVPISQSRWPMPPAGVERTPSQGNDASTPTARSFPVETEDRDVQATHPKRPVSNIVSSLLSKESPRASTDNAVDNVDMDLLRSTVESFRQVCQELSEGEASMSDVKALRERLEVAKRVLNGEL